LEVIGIKSKNLGGDWSTRHEQWLHKQYTTDDREENAKKKLRKTGRRIASLTDGKAKSVGKIRIVVKSGDIWLTGTHAAA